MTKTPAGFAITNLHAGAYTVATPTGEWAITKEPSLGGWLVQDKRDGDVVPTFKDAASYVDASVVGMTEEQ